MFDFLYVALIICLMVCMKASGIVPHYTMMPRSSREYYRNVSGQSYVPSSLAPDLEIDVQQIVTDGIDNIGDDLEQEPIPTYDISESEALADFMAGFYGPYNHHDNQDRSEEDGFNPEWVQLEKDGITPL